jgi:CobQ-like glutamine amidotransferase family enzyme
MTTSPAGLPPLRIAHLWPSLLNVAGDGGNVTILERRCAWRGIPTEIVEYDAGDTVPDLGAVDVLLVQGGQDREMAAVAADLPRVAGALRDAADAGVVMLAVCAGLQLLGHAYIPNAGPALEGAHVIDLETRGGSQRFMQHAACEVEIAGETGTVVGFENHSGVTELGPGAVPFGRVVAGAGNNGRDGTEGARRDNVFATYLHGPVLPKNPWLADQLLRIALERRTGAPVTLAPLDDAVETHSHDVALAKAMRNRGQRTALTPARLGRS